MLSVAYPDKKVIKKKNGVIRGRYDWLIPQLAICSGLLFEIILIIKIKKTPEIIRSGKCFKYGELIGWFFCNLERELISISLS